MCVPLERCVCLARSTWVVPLMSAELFLLLRNRSDLSTFLNVAPNGADRFSSWSSGLSYTTAVAGCEISLFLTYPGRRRLGGVEFTFPAVTLHQLFVRNMAKKKKKSARKDFWACHPVFPNHLPGCISQLLCETRKGELVGLYWLWKGEQICSKILLDQKDAVIRQERCKSGEMMQTPVARWEQS